MNQSPINSSTITVNPIRFLSLFLVILLLGGCSFNSHQAKQTETFTLSKSRYGHASVSDGRYVYLFGGSGEKGMHRDIEIIDSQTGEVQILESELIPRRYHAAVWDGQDKVYLVGGVSYRRNRFAIVPIVEVFDIKTQQVTREANHPFPTRLNTAAYLDGKVYVFGGSRSQRGQGLRSVAQSWVYNVLEDVWRPVADMPVAKDSKAVVYDNKIYLFGGYDYKHSLAGVEQFDPKTGVWQSLPEQSVAISAHSATVAGDGVYLFGNYDDLGATYRYDFASQQLSPIELGYIPRRHTAIASTSRGVYVTGGTIRTENGAVAVAQRFSL